MMAAVLGGLGQGLGAVGGAISASQSSEAPSAPSGVMGPPAPSYIANPFPASSLR